MCVYVRACACMHVLCMLCVCERDKEREMGGERSGENRKREGEREVMTMGKMREGEEEGGRKKKRERRERVKGTSLKEGRAVIQIVISKCE